ncbi:thioesterase family protein [Nonomuraea jabiensis]|uniref:thioesterase family protein n=1 Tax=Nonomuraea jabiensis TaxID=882448 RepID=UPI003D73FC60
MHASLQPGLTARLDYVVPTERTVPHLLPESDHFARLPAVLATGYLVGIVEWTCMRALDGHLEDGEQTLGVHVNLSHQAPTPPGSTLTVHAELSSVDGTQLTFTVHAHDDADTVCQGTHRRAVINTERFHARLRTRTAAHADPAQPPRSGTSPNGSSEQDQRFGNRP